MGIGAAVREKVFRIAFRILATESEFVENSPGFAWFLKESWSFHKHLY